MTRTCPQCSCTVYKVRKLTLSNQTSFCVCQFGQTFATELHPPFCRPSFSSSQESSALPTTVSLPYRAGGEVLLYCLTPLFLLLSHGHLCRMSKIVKQLGMRSSTRRKKLERFQFFKQIFASKKGKFFQKKFPPRPPPQGCFSKKNSEALPISKKLLRFSASRTRQIRPNHGCHCSYMLCTFRYVPLKILEVGILGFFRTWTTHTTI